MIPTKNRQGARGNVLGQLDKNIISYVGILLTFSFIKIKVRGIMRYTTFITGAEEFLGL